ncbi:N-acetyl-alpha-D-glucosaminyl L-malate synthase BshA [Algoriphagus sp. oki45]|uniref:glycosyltransferase family 4 protein n=1 Tax=Algoriphagus sp. oki45 TaxID=3067294 RepID=UPI0027F057B6|nr:N-acetyl-alpha-D-glucosaminyl L-malate synthase BshA [Algoriphagus sp. oki45]
MSKIRKKVGIGIPCLLIGGTEIQTVHLVKALAQEGYGIKVVCYFEYDPWIVSKLEDLGAEVVLLKWNRSISPIRFIRSLSQELRKYKFDYFHVQYVAPGLLPILAAKLAKIKKVLATVHQPKTRSHGRFAGILLRTAALACDSFLSVSKNTEKSWFGSAQLFDPKIHTQKVPAHCTIYNTLDTDWIDEQLSDLKDSTSVNHPFRIGTVSRLNYVKGIDILIQAFHQVNQEKVGQVELVIYGEGDDEARLKQMVSDLGLEKQVLFKGKLNPSEVIHETALLDLVVVPSRFEAFGLFAAEAMYIGKPVVASESFGLLEVISHGETGYLFPVEDAGKLAESITHLIDNPDLRISLGQKGRISIKEKFGFGSFQQNIANLYRLL